jgi:hypothetical protein
MHQYGAIGEMAQLHSLEWSVTSPASKKSPVEGSMGLYFDG